MSDRALTVLLAGAEAGTLRQEDGGRLAFEYDARWRASGAAMALSLSMPLAARRHQHRVVEAFLWGLLPDSERVLDGWGRRFGVSARNPFALVAQVGEDCAGAVQFVRPERLAALGAGAPEEIEWLDERAVADRLRALRHDPSTWRTRADFGQFSLAGAQPKTALLRRDGRWGVPAGRTPTTHILKPPTGEFDGHAENEHLCLTLARALGLPSAESEVTRFEDEVAIVVRRYDRADAAPFHAAAIARAAAETAGHAADAADNPRALARAATAAARTAAAAARVEAFSALADAQPVLRLHQEDMCQALGRPPTAKYQNDGGPSPEEIVALLRVHSARASEDVGTFADALALNWITGGTDAHAKNYSMLHGRGGRVRLAPLYDVASALPYPNLDPRRLKLAMKIGGSYGLTEVAPRHWEAFARANRFAVGAILDRVRDLAAAVVREVGPVHDRAAAAGLSHSLVGRWATSVAARGQACSRLLASSGVAAEVSGVSA